MLRLIFMYMILSNVLMMSPYGQINVYAAPNTTESNSVADCIKSKDLCKKETAVKNQENSDLPIKNEANPISIFTFFKMILALIFVIFLIYFLLRLVNKKGNIFSQYRYIQNVGGTSLGSNRSIQLVKAGNRILVVGVGDSIHLLKEIDDEKEINEILADHSHRNDQLVQSKDLFKKLLQRKTIQKNQPEQSKQQFGILLKEQLQELTKGRKKTFNEMDKKGNNHHE